MYVCIENVDKSLYWLKMSQLRFIFVFYIYMYIYMNINVHACTHIYIFVYVSVKNTTETQYSIKNKCHIPPKKIFLQEQTNSSLTFFKTWRVQCLPQNRISFKI